MVVFAVDDTDSLVEAEQILSYLKSEDILKTQAVILVANKIDLVRSRVITTNGTKIFWTNTSTYTQLGFLDNRSPFPWEISRYIKHSSNLFCIECSSVFSLSQKKIC